jgi:hypothetical protein
MFFTGFFKVAGEDAYRWSKASIRSLLKLEPKRGSTERSEETQAKPQPAAVPLSGLAYADIQAELERTTPMLRSEVAARYVGLRVHWAVLLLSAHPYGNSVTLHLMVAGTKSELICCDVAARDYPQLKFLAKGAPLHVIGEIKSITPMATNLKNARLEFPQHDSRASE